MDQTEEILLERLWTCVAASEYCADKCLEMHNSEALMECIRVCRDCSDICTSAARFVARGSILTGNVLGICAEVCRVCSYECLKLDMPSARNCAQACMACLEACEAYAE